MSGDETVTDPITPDDGLRRAAVAGAGWSLVQAWGGRLISTVAFFVLARLLVPDEFGVVALAVIVIELGQMIMNRGFGAVIVQREDLSDDDVDAAFWFSLSMGVAMAVVVSLLAGPLAAALDEPDFAPVLRVLTLSWVLAAFWSIPQNLLQRELRFKSLAARRLIAVTIGGIVAVTLAVAGAGVWSLVALSLVQSVISIAVLWSISPWRPRWRLSRASLRSMRGFAVRMVAIDVIRFFAIRGEGLVIGFAIGPLALGYYAVAQRFLTLMREVFTASIGRVAFPVFARLQGDDERRIRALRAVVRMSSLAAFPAFCGLAVLAPQIVDALLGPKWQPSVVLIQILALHGLRVAITYFVTGVVTSTGNAALELRVLLVGVAVKAVALAIGIQFGVLGVAWAVVAASYATLPLTFYALRRSTGLTAASYLRQTLAPAIAAAVMGAAVLGLREFLDGRAPSIVILVAGIGLGITVYSVAISLLAPGVMRELRSIVADLRGRRERPVAASGS
jgi:PST family polysaccharide transporter